MKLIDFIACEDIRHEIGNKMTLVGIYADQLSIMVLPKPAEDKWPKGIKMGIFIRIKVDDSPMPDAFTMQFFQNEKEVDGIKGNVTIPTPSTKVDLLNLAIVFGNFKISGIGEIKFRLKLLKDGEVIYEVSPDYTLKIAGATAQEMFQMK